MSVFCVIPLKRISGVYSAAGGKDLSPRHHTNATEELHDGGNSEIFLTYFFILDNFSKPLHFKPKVY